MDIHANASPWPLASDSRVMAVRGDLPIRNDRCNVDCHRFYVRDCYDTLYERVLHHWDGSRTDIIAITGSPGVGKSLFLTYFFERYHAEHPDAIVVAQCPAMDPTGALAYTVLWPPRLFDKDAVHVQPTTSTSDTRELCHGAIRAAQDLDVPCVALLDGPPPRAVCVKGIQVLCTVSVDEIDLVTSQRPRVVELLCMPLWTCEELLQAADALALHPRLGADPIATRYETFGGVAHKCLHGDFSTVAAYQRRLTTLVASTFDARDVCQLLRLCGPPLDGSSADAGGVTLLHVIAVETKDGHVAMRLASSFVQRLIQQRLTWLPNAAERERVLQWIHHQPHLQHVPVDDMRRMVRMHVQMRKGSDKVTLLETRKGFHSRKSCLHVRLAPNSRQDDNNAYEQHCYHACPPSLVNGVDGYCLRPVCLPPVPRTVSRQERLTRLLTCGGEPDEPYRSPPPIALLFIAAPDSQFEECAFHVSGRVILHTLQYLDQLASLDKDFTSIGLVFALSRDCVDRISRRDDYHMPVAIRLDVDLRDATLAKVMNMPHAMVMESIAALPAHWTLEDFLHAHKDVEGHCLRGMVGRFRRIQSRLQCVEQFVVAVD